MSTRDRQPKARAWTMLAAGAAAITWLGTGLDIAVAQSNPRESAPTLDHGSTKTGVIITEDYTARVPTGRTFLDILGAAATAVRDGFGIAFDGATSPENAYVIDGLDGTDLVYGGATAVLRGASTTTNLPNEFIQEVEVITGGYGPAHGRAAGSMVQVSTKSGGNELAGTVFLYFTPGSLSAAPQRIEQRGSAISRRDALVYEVSTGAELGGPIVQNQVWFHVGVNPVLTTSDVKRIISTYIDKNHDGQPDVDPRTGFEIARPVGETTFRRSRQIYMFTGKLSYVVSPQHQGSTSIVGSPGSQDTLRSVAGRESASRLTVEDGALDVSSRWSSKLHRNKTQVDAIIGYHRNIFRELPAPGGDIPQVVIDQGSLAELAAFEPDGQVPAACVDRGAGAEDPWPGIVNCPVADYNVGGLGRIETLIGGRLVGSLQVTRSVRAAGQHRLEAGLDLEHTTLERRSAYTGGERLSYSPERPQDVLVRGFFKLDSQGDIPCGDFTCSPVPEGVHIHTATRNLSWFVEDAWSMLPNLTALAGLRWEQQTLFAAEETRGQVSLSSGDIMDREAFTVSNMWAPRLGAIYDWSAEGRSKLYAHWGRYYQAIPMYVNSMAFGGEISGHRIYDMGNCTPVGGQGPASCAGEPYASLVTGGDQQMVAPDIQGQYLDQVLAGVDYEILSNLVIGASVTRRDLGRIVEDVSADRGRTAIIANPGELVNPAAIEALRAEAARERMIGNDRRADYLDTQADSYAMIGVFDRPRRVYQAVQLRASKRFSHGFMAQVAYTYSRTVGNLAGVSDSRDDEGGLAPHIGNLYDLPDILSNQDGALPQDTPHLFKLDGYWHRDLDERGWVSMGASVRARSGMPRSARGVHPDTGESDTMILPRGSMGRMPTVARFDTKLTYGRQLTQDNMLEVFVDIFNLFNHRFPLTADEKYTSDRVHPIVGGNRRDLAHLKRLDRHGNRTSELARAEPNFANATAVQAPLSVRIGLRLSF